MNTAQIQALGKTQFNDSFQCPHCSVAARFEPEFAELATLENYRCWFVWAAICPACKNIVVLLIDAPSISSGKDVDPDQILWRGKRSLAYPKVSARAQLPSWLPVDIREDHLEASLVLDISPKASAALSRRCLQRLLKDYAGADQAKLADQIEFVLSSLPDNLQKTIDVIRHHGNIAAHPDELFPDVGADEAEWCLQILEGLVEYYIIRPQLDAVRLKEINKKLQSANKKPLKGSVGPEDQT